MQEAKSIDDQFRDLFYFFKNAEINNEEVMYAQIREILVDRSKDSIYWYARHFWTWFLKEKERRGSYVVFFCRGIRRYSEDYFVQAHHWGQGKYFYHFAGAMNDAKRKALEKKRLKKQENNVQLEDSLEPLEQPSEVGQDDPEELDFTSDEAGEKIAGGTLLEDTSPDETIPAENTGRALVPVSSSPSWIERIITSMFGGLSKQERASLVQAIETLTMLQKDVQDLKNQQATLSSEALKQLRTEVAQEIQKEQGVLRSEITGKIDGLVTTIDKIPRLAPIDLSSIHANIAEKARKLEDTIKTAIERLPSPPDAMAISNALEQTIGKELDKLPLPPDATAIGMIVERIVGDAIQKLPALPDATAINNAVTAGSEKALQEHDEQWLQALKNTVPAPAVSSEWFGNTTLGITKLLQHLNALEQQLTVQHQSLSLDGAMFTPELVDEAMKQTNVVIGDALTNVKDIMNALGKAYIVWFNNARQTVDGTNPNSEAKKDRLLREIETEKDRLLREIETEKDRRLREIETEKDRRLREIETEEQRHSATRALFSPMRVVPDGLAQGETQAPDSHEEMVQEAEKNAVPDGGEEATPEPGNPIETKAAQESEEDVVPDGGEEPEQEPENQ